MRWTHEGLPLAWDGASDNKGLQTGVNTALMSLGPIGSLAAFQREVFIVPPCFWRIMKDCSNENGAFTSVNVHGMDGKLKRTAIWQCSNRAIPRIDGKGNIYLADMVRPKDRIAPAFFDGKRPQPAANDFDVYNYIYASIVKFPPSGGAIWYDKNDQDGKPPYLQGSVPNELKSKPEMAMSYPGPYYRGLRHGTIQGAEWLRFGFAPFSNKLGGGTSTCHCENAGFDVDDFGRVFFPNLGQFRVEVVDPANNMIGTFGNYGNMDSGGKDAKVKTPAIPLAWPTYVAVSDRYAYINDTINLRIVRVKLSYEADAACVIR